MKQNKKLQYKLKILHQLPHRIRFSYAFEEGKSADTLCLEEMLFVKEGITKVKVNALLQTIVMHFKSLHVKDIVMHIEDCLERISLSSHREDGCIFKEALPSSQGVVWAGTSLALEPFLSTPHAKLGASIISATPILKEGLNDVLTMTLSSKVLEALAIAISLYRKDFKAANSASFMLSLGEYIEESSVYKSDDLVRELSKPQTKEAWVEKEGALIQVPTHALQIGDIVVVGSGEMIGVDGHIVAGDALINQISMTGESEPVHKTSGDRVLSGTTLQEGMIKIWAENVGEGTATQRIRSYITNSLHERSSQELEASKMADGLVPITLGLAILSYVSSRDLTRLASVLQADYSCALKLATPVAFKSAIGVAGKKGVMVKGAKSLEALSSADVFVFDKTGTLTKGELEVASVHSFHAKWSKERILSLAASAEEHYFHPVAQAVVKAARSKSFVHMHHEEVEFVVAHGVKTKVKDKEVLIGSRHFLEEDEKIDFAPLHVKMLALLEEGFMPLFIGYDKKLLGMILLKDEIRENAKEALLRLRKSGVKEIVMLTGDCESKAKEVSEMLGIDSFHAQLLPTQKGDIIEKMMQEGKKVAFVGDGINDAPALMRAHTGISMHKGADIAKASADVVLLKDDIEMVAMAREIADKTMEKIAFNFKVTVGVNSAILGAAAFGFLSPIKTALLHNGTTIALLLNALRSIDIKTRNH